MTAHVHTCRKFVCVEEIKTSIFCVYLTQEQIMPSSIFVTTLRNCVPMFIAFIAVHDIAFKVIVAVFDVPSFPAA